VLFFAFLGTSKGMQGMVYYMNKGSTQIFGYCDAGWPESPIEKHSTTGYCVFIERDIIAWKNKNKL